MLMFTVHALRREYASEGEAERGDHERGGIRKMANAQRKIEGIGPITKDGMPVALRSVSSIIYLIIYVHKLLKFLISIYC